MTELTNRVILKPDKNRQPLESSAAKKLEDGIIEQSGKLKDNPWDRGEQPRVLLMVPPYTKIIRPLEAITDSIFDKVTNDEHWKFYENLASQLRREGIESLEEMKRAGVPMGLLRMGTAAKKTGYDIKVIDCVFEGWNNENHMFTSSEGDSIKSYGLSEREIERKIREYNPHVVGISCSYTHQWGNARALADLMKKIQGDIPVIVGGVHVTGLPGDALLGAPTDYAVVRQADASFVNLLDFITNKEGAVRNSFEIPGIAFKQDNKAWQTFPRPYMKSIDDIAIPDLSLINLELYSGEYHSAGKRKTKEGHLLYGFTSTGCNTGCNFCAIPTSQGGFRKMNEQKLDEYLKYITSQGVREFLVEDDHLMHDPEWARHVFKKMKEYGLPWVEEGGVGLFNLIALLPQVDELFVRKSAINHKLFDKTLEAKKQGLNTEQLIKEMKDGGCYSLYLAVESANSESLGNAHKPKLNAIGKYTTEVVRIFNRYGIDTTCGLMLGFIEPDHEGIYVETRDKIIQTIQYGKILSEAGASFINPFIVTPLPGAPNFRSLEQNLRGSLLRNTDIGYSHEFATVDAPDCSWTRDEMNLLRVHALLEGNGIQKYKQMVQTGTWPVN